MPLAEIKDLVTESDPDKVWARLEAHRSVLEERIDRDRNMLKRVEDFIRSRHEAYGGRSGETDG
jgi:hypothetical protein